MSTQPVVHLFSCDTRRSRVQSGSLFRRLDLRRFVRGLFRRAAPAPSLEVAANPRLLLLLADQELAEGREEQARYLVEAAYEYFDRETVSNVYRLNLAG